MSDKNYKPVVHEEDYALIIKMLMFQLGIQNLHACPYEIDKANLTLYKVDMKAEISITHGIRVNLVETTQQLM